MSTLNLPSRLLKSNRLVPLGLGLCLGLSLAGCSTTSGNRAGSMSKAKTFLSVGDKPLPVVSGEPGSTVAADSGQEPQVAPRNGRPDGRISGRVFDADGRPAPEARVRLAVSGAAGGKVVRASTDRSGAFTLHGLRPGSTYTLIAEWEGDDGLMSGRSEARTSDTDVRISLASEDAPPRRAGAQSRVNRVSDREVEDEDAATPAEVAPAVEADDGATSRSRSRINEEDLPPAPEAESLAPPNGTRASTSTSISPRRARMGTAQAESWRQGVRDGSAAGRAEGPPAPVEPEARQETPTAQGDGETPYDEGPNPLPPALEPAEEPDKSASTRTGGRVEPDPFAEDPPRVAARAPAPRPRSSPAPSNATRRPAASLPFESPSRPSEAPARTLPIDTAPGALVVVPETFAPVVLHDADPFAPPAAPEPEPRPAAVRPTRPRANAGVDSTSRSARPSNAPGASLASRDRPDANGRRRRTWGEVASTESAVPPLEGEAETDSGGRASGAKADAGIALGSLTSDDRSAARAVGTDKGAGKPSCDYDERLRRINDFRLPDVSGKLVRFQDFDADLVLIDFWGTWCQPCLQSIPHLVDLQERMGRRLAVIGVACEPEATDQAAVRVSATVKRLKINYPVLISRNDGSCPLQEALHVQAFPTMILVDRQGRVLWRDQGSTPTTLSRLDRFLASASPTEDTRRN
jgi:thiol-disulfide isomerase/thioredoxin